MNLYSSYFLLMQSSLPCMERALLSMIGLWTIDSADRNRVRNVFVYLIWTNNDIAHLKTYLEDRSGVCNRWFIRYSGTGFDGMVHVPTQLWWSMKNYWSCDLSWSAEASRTCRQYKWACRRKICSTRRVCFSNSKAEWPESGKLYISHCRCTDVLPSNLFSFVWFSRDCDFLAGYEFNIVM